MNPSSRAGWLAVVMLCAPLVAAEPQLDLEYGQAAGESLKLDAWVPDGAGPFPAVILIHGGGWSTGDKSGGTRKAFMAPMHAPLERAGLAWFSINYRLAPKHRYPACIEDVETAIRWVKANAAKFRIDPRRIGISGESAGAHLAALAAVRADDAMRLAAVAAFYGPFDFEAMAPAGEALRPGFKSLIGREVADESARTSLREASPIRYVKRGLPPFLLVHGTADKQVPFAQSEIFLARLRDLGVPCELLVVKDGGHGMLPWEAIMPGYGDRVAEWLRRRLTEVK